MRRLVVSLAAMALVWPANAAYAATPEVVLDVPSRWENSPSASDGYLAWSTTNTENFRSNSYVMADGGSPVRVNRAGTRSGSAAIDGTTVAYDEVDHDSDIVLFDAVSKTRSQPPDGVNTPGDEIRPSLSGNWLLFTRSNANRVSRSKAARKVILFNLYDSTSILLARVRERTGYLISDQVNGDWATFEKCDVHRFVYSDCQAHRYRISTDKLTEIPNPGVPQQQYAASVSKNGTVYMVRTRTRDHWRCGDHTRLVRYPIGGPPTVIAQLPVGFDALETFAFDEKNGSTTMYFGRLNCKNGRSGIYRITDADTAT